jgi:hypothetical protein
MTHNEPITASAGDRANEAGSDAPGGGYSYVARGAGG